MQPHKKKQRQSMDEKWTAMLRVGIGMFLGIFVMFLATFLYCIFSQEWGATILVIPFLFLSLLEIKQFKKVQKCKDLNQLDVVSYTLLKLLGVLY